MLINNAGIPGSGISIEDGVVEDLRANFETHCLGAAVVCEAVVHRFGPESLSFVVNISSRLGSLSDNRNDVHAHLETSYAYRVAKAAQKSKSCPPAQIQCSKPTMISTRVPGRERTAFLAYRVHLKRPIVRY